jgi:hypothetical protein
MDLELRGLITRNMMPLLLVRLVWNHIDHHSWYSKSIVDKIPLHDVSNPMFTPNLVRRICHIAIALLIKLQMLPFWHFLKMVSGMPSLSLCV